MYRLILPILIVSVGYLGYAKYFGTSDDVDTTGYSISQADQKPIPKKVFYALWTDVALSKCADARTTYNLSPEECQKTITERSKVCTSQQIQGAPELINAKAVAKEYGRPYLDCITPYYFCKGVEVKTEEEVRQKCQ